MEKRVGERIIYWCIGRCNVLLLADCKSARPLAGAVIRQVLEKSSFSTKSDRL